MILSTTFGSFEIGSTYSMYWVHKDDPKGRKITGLTIGLDSSLRESESRIIRICRRRKPAKRQMKQMSPLRGQGAEFGPITLPLLTCKIITDSSPHPPPEGDIIHPSDGLTPYSHAGYNNHFHLKAHPLGRYLDESKFIHLMGLRLRSLNPLSWMIWLLPEMVAHNWTRFFYPSSAPYTFESLLIKKINRSWLK